MPSFQGLTDRTATAAASRGSVTITQSTAGPSQPTLRLRAVNDTHTEDRPRVTWTQQVVDNEHMGKKSSKICCIYHRRREAGDPSSSESNTDSSSGSESEDPDLPSESKKSTAKRQPRHDHVHKDCHQKHGSGQGSKADADDQIDDAGEGSSSGPPPRKSQVSAGPRTRSPNAYERLPRRRKGT